MLSFTTNTYLETLYAEDIERFRYLHFNVENRLETNIVYTDFSTYRRLTTEQKKIVILIKEDKKWMRVSHVNESRFFVSKLMHQRSERNMLSKLKFVGKVLSNTITGQEQFFISRIILTIF